MADFVDDRAGEEPEEKAVAEGSEDGDGLPSDEPEASDSDSGDSSAEGSEEEDEFENDGFIVDEAEDEGGSKEEGGGGEGGGSDAEGVEGAEEAKKRRKKKRHRELVLDEEDYELLEEATGIRRQRPTLQHRRIKKARDAEGPSGTGGGTGDAAQDAARALQQELFGQEELQDGSGLEDEEDEDEGGGGAYGRPPSAAAGVGRDSRAGGRDDGAPPEADDQFDDDEDDWLVHEDEEEGGDVVAARQRRRQRRAALEGMPDIDPDALAEAEDIFGNVDELLSMYEERKAQQGAHLEEAEEEEEADEEDMDEEAAEARRLAREERQRAAAARRVREQLDPEALAKHFMLPKDEQIREADLPEREQLHRGPDPASADFAACAEWVWDHLVGERRSETLAESLLKYGVREVEGPPPAWYGHSRWDPRDLKGEIHDMASHRGLYCGRERDSEARRAWRHNREAQVELKGCITAVLEQIYGKHNEVPFLAQYRKELCGELLAVRSRDEPSYTREEDATHDCPYGTIRAHHRRIRRYEVLYAVQALAQRWRALQVRREARQQAYEKALGDTMHSAEQAAIQACLDLLRAADSMEELEDCESKFRLATQQFAPEDALSQLSLEGHPGMVGPRRRVQKSARYALCLRGGLGGWVQGLGLSAAQLAENVEAGYKKHEPTDLQVTPEAHAEAFVAGATGGGGGFSSVETVVRGGIHMAATEIAAEPLVRQEVRKQYKDMAVVWTSPTPTGEAAIDPFHPLGPVKRLRAKPLKEFEGNDHFMRLLQAEKEGLITVRFGFEERDDKESGDTMIDSLAESYLSGGLSEVGQAWDKMRQRVIAEAVRELLMPLMEREARSRLGSAARAAALDAAADRLWAHASQAPLQVRLVDEDEAEPERRVMAVCYGPGSPPTTFVMLDPAGNMVDYLHCSQFSGLIPKRKALPGLVYNMYEDPKKGQDAARVRSFIEDHRPHAIVIGASNPEARTLEQDLVQILDSILLDNPRFNIELGTGQVQILMADESVAAAWENSAPAQEELAAATPAPIVRRAVALGRQLLDPLAVLASLCGRGREVLALQLHPLQAQLTEEERMGMVERVMTSATSQVGVDINAAAANAWLAPPLQFVPGLGPRKAAALLRGVARAGGFVESRNQVWRELGVLGNRVFRNCAPYLRIKASTKGTANLELDPLDDTRIHPESYHYAIQMAKSALPGAEDEEEGVAVENAFQRPQEVEKLELVYYDKHLQDEAAATGEAGALVGSRLATLIDIQMEFVSPYGELRTELTALKPEKAFWLCAGETEETLKPGRRVEARVRSVGESDARCILPDINGIEAIIERRNVSLRGGEDINVRDFLEQNATVPARVLEIDAKEWVVRLTTRSDDLNDDAKWELKYRPDKFYIVPDPEEQRRAARERRASQANKVVHRPIQHPLFKNVTFHEACAQLEGSDVPVGACVIRPSARGPSRLCLSMKLPESFWHLDLEEQGKNPASLKLGTSMTMELAASSAEQLHFTFEDLDEVAARFVEPMQSNLRQLVGHRKYKNLAWEKAKEDLAEEKASKPPGYAAYAVGPEPTYGGQFWLGHVMSRTPAREFFMVCPDGFYFRKKVYPSVDRMLVAWQRSPKVPPKQQLPPEPVPRQQQASPPRPPPRQAYQQQVPTGMMAGQGAPMPSQGQGYYQPGPAQPVPPVYGYAQQQQQPPLPPGGYGGPAGPSFGGAPPGPQPGYWPPQQQQQPPLPGGYGPPQGQGFPPGPMGPGQGFPPPHPQQGQGFPPQQGLPPQPQQYMGGPPRPQQGSRWGPGPPAPYGR